MYTIGILPHKNMVAADSLLGYQEAFALTT
jgi:hypothetical protein